MADRARSVYLKSYRNLDPATHVMMVDALTNGGNDDFEFAMEQVEAEDREGGRVARIAPKLRTEMVDDLQEVYPGVPLAAIEKILSPGPLVIVIVHNLKFYAMSRDLPE